jgi:hypothetical protein
MCSESARDRVNATDALEADTNKWLLDAHVRLRQLPCTVQTQSLFHLAYDSDLLEYRFLFACIIGSTSYLHTCDRRVL